MSPFPPLTGLKLVESTALAGTKKAIRTGDTLYVSPAMLSLISTADEAFLQLLGRSIQVIDIGPMPDPWEMRTVPVTRS